jgi:hypothetical protein
MDTKLLKSDTELSDEGVAYVAMQIEVFKGLDDLKIDEIEDAQFYNPDIDVLLAVIEPEFRSRFTKLSTVKYSANSAKLAAMDIKVNYDEARAIRFLGLKGKVKKIFCDIVAPLIAPGGEFDLKTIITAVATAVLGAFAAGPLGAALLPFIIAIIIRLITKGIDNVCEVR